ncbi:hypothetical protein ON010_g17532 [Phytophthora cinnamomi]|nr:hypothetical protein ON010_g17532 [Phytophthora cinnamomi]
MTLHATALVDSQRLQPAFNGAEALSPAGDAGCCCIAATLAAETGTSMCSVRQGALAGSAVGPNQSHKWVTSARFPRLVTGKSVKEATSPLQRCSGCQRREPSSSNAGTRAVAGRRMQPSRSHAQSLTRIYVGPALAGPKD